MSRAGSSSQTKALTITEELERLEQSITLTLQGNRDNFSACASPIDELQKSTIISAGRIGLSPLASYRLSNSMPLTLKRFGKVQDFGNSSLNRAQMFRFRATKSSRRKMTAPRRQRLRVRMLLRPLPLRRRSRMKHLQHNIYRPIPYKTLIYRT
jgi:hypothetical protein